MEELTDEQIKLGFWYWNREPKFPPQAITKVEDYHPKSKLNLSITQLDKTPKEQNKIIDQWCELLPTLNDVKYLWFCSRVNQKIFDAACKVPNIEGLYIKWSGIKDITNLSQMKNLKHLHLGSSAQVESIDVLSGLGNLLTLNLEQLNKINDFSPVSSLVNLKGLGIDGGMWTAQKIASLKPIGSLTKLKYLTLINTRAQDKSFEPILHLKELIRFNSSWNYPEAEFKKLKSLPNLKYGNVETSLKEIKERYQLQQKK